MEGLQNLDLAATRALYADKVPKKQRLTESQKRILARVLTGAIRPLSRMYKAKLCSTPVCPWCKSGEEETKEHMFWRCEAWKEQRRGYLTALKAIGFKNEGGEREGCGALWWCGLCNEDPRLREAWEEIPEEDGECPIAKGAGEGRGEQREEEESSSKESEDEGKEEVRKEEGTGEVQSMEAERTEVKEAMDEEAGEQIERRKKWFPVEPSMMKWWITTGNSFTT